MIYIRKYERGDLYEILTKKFLKSMNIEYIPEYLIEEKYAWTLCDDNRVLLCAGFHPMWNNVFEVWLHPRSYEEFLKHKLLVIRQIRKEISNLAFNRLQAIVDVDCRNHSHLMKLLGFISEGTLLKYNPAGNDCIMYARVR